MRSTVLLFALLTVSLSPATFAQERTLSGTWLLKAEAARGQTENGGDWTRSAISGTLDVEQKGATLEGSWKGPVAL
jgi:hypothetical protein